MSDTTLRATQLQPPVETAGWLVLKEGYLTKSKLAKGLIKSTKLRYFVLKQNPKTLESRLEYYEGLVCKGWVSLRDIKLTPSKKQGTFSLTSFYMTMGQDSQPGIPVTRSMTLTADKLKPKEGSAWIVALDSASRAYREKLRESAKLKALTQEMRRSVVNPELIKGIEQIESSVAQRANRSGNDAAIDGDAIDRARWNALRAKYADEGGDDDLDLEEDEEVKQLRELEAEEERRQEEERLAFLAERQARLAQKENVQGLQDTELDDGEISEDDDWDPEAYARELREAELEEERRQEEERQQWLAERERQKAAKEAS